MKRFLRQYLSEGVVCSHYAVVKDIYRNGHHYSGVTADHPFKLPFPNINAFITSQCMFVEYSSGEIRAIDFTDRNDDILRCTLLPDLTGAMLIQYEKEHLANRAEIINTTVIDHPPYVQPEKLYPGYYGIRGFYTKDSNDVSQFSKYVTKRNSKLYFRGLKTNTLRDCLTPLAKYADTEIFEDSIGADEYFKEFGSHKIVLGLPGGGDVCFRDFEAFALKIPLLRPEYSVTLAEPLVPDFHYIKVILRDRNDPEIVAEDIMKRYYEVIEDESFCEFITTNAYEYYKEFGTYTKVSKRFFEFLLPTIL